MNSQKEKLWTGAFVIIGFTLFIIAFTALTSDESIFRRKNTYYASVKNSQGIMFGSIVSFSGIDVGHVSNITYDPKSQKIIIELRINKSYSHLITDKSLVSMKTQGALGDRFIYISPGENGTPLKNLSFIESDNRPDLLDQIESKLSDFEQVSITLKKIDAIITNFSNGADFERMGKNADLALENFAGAAAKIKDQANIKPTLDRLNQSLDAINSKKGTLGQLIYDPTLHTKVMKFLGEEKDDNYIKSLMRRGIEAKESKQK
jgi:phospholipid/cholesterol/gamma-HCH transport system substrate-binding protein